MKRHETINSTGKTFLDLNGSHIFLDQSLKAKLNNKIKNNRWDPIKLKSFYTVKETINKIKRQLIEWEKIFTNNATERCYFPEYINISHNYELNTKNNKIIINVQKI